MYYLGIDTSCYTTSVALIDEDDNLVSDERIMLKVKGGERGIRQSEAFYQHIGNLDTLLKKLYDIIDPKKIKALGISSKPRKNPDSYMPVFNSGLHIGSIVGKSLGIPMFLLSHQENHILAGLWSKKFTPYKPIAAYHISGGTTELLHITEITNMDIKIMGGSSDLKAGQFIDRVGVSMGLNFPCGREMDRLSQSVKDTGIIIPSSVKENYASYSGPETFTQKIIKSGRYDISQISKAVFLCIAKSIEETLINSKDTFDWKEVLFIGGVSSNSIIKEYLSSSERIKKNNIRPVFSEGRFAVDNALGGAIYAKKRYRSC